VWTSAIFVHFSCRKAYAQHQISYFYGKLKSFTLQLKLQSTAKTINIAVKNKVCIMFSVKISLGCSNPLNSLPQSWQINQQKSI